MNKQKIPKPKKYQQNHEVKQHFHPRSLARSIVHSRMANSDMFGVNKVRPGTTQSYFSRLWRKDAAMFARDEG